MSGAAAGAGRAAPISRPRRPRSVLAWLVLDDAIDEAFLGWGAGAPAARLVRGLALAAITEGAPYILQVSPAPPGRCRLRRQGFLQ